MPVDTLAPAERVRTFPVLKKRTRFFGLTLDECIKAFFGGNAFVAVVVLALITVFLAKEGIGFFVQNRENLEVYRRAGLEYVDMVREQEARFTEVNRQLLAIRIQAVDHLVNEEGLDIAAANQQLTSFDDWAYEFGDTIEPIRAIVSEWTELASALKTRYNVAEDRREERRQLIAVGRSEDAAAVEVEEIDFAQELQPLIDSLPAYREARQQFVANLDRVLAQENVQLPTPELRKRLEDLKARARSFAPATERVESRLANWNFREPVTLGESIRSFFFGTQWLTASFWQDRYGVLPLFTGSLLVSMIALALAVPLGVGGAIYVNQIASAREQRLIKPSIEFISAIPSVVLGFFGIVVLGETLRVLSQQEWLSWFPGFPIAERLNALTAGMLLALIAVPTIFTLAEDALQNVPRAFKEASYALGATRLQTTFRIIVPASLSGIISAVLLGFGRVIGETMVVLLVAGNRIAIPDFTSGFGVVTQPVHTMTGIIAQEMGEVVRGSIHYRALFMVGVFLFVLALGINYVAQKIVARYRISIG